MDISSPNRIIAVLLVLQIWQAKRIDDAQVSFATMTAEEASSLKVVHENMRSEINKKEECDKFINNISNNASPCVDFIITTRSRLDGMRLVLGDETQLRKSGYNSSNQLVIIVHGFFQNPKKKWVAHAREALLNYGDINVVVLDWRAFSQHVYYPRVVVYSMKVAEYLAQFIEFCVAAGTDLAKIHLIGHSLGAHISGVASHKVTMGVVGRITALDAARPLFKSFEDEFKLDKTDALFVDCIHTSGGFVGMDVPFCHADFFVNGGRVQPGCPEFLSLGKCGHFRATKYFIETISDVVRYEAFKCSSVSYMDPVTCWKEGAVMGYLATESHKGIFYVQTGVRTPYYTASSQQEVEDAEKESLNPMIWNADLK